MNNIAKTPLNPQISVDMLNPDANPYELGYTYEDIIHFRRNYNYNKVKYPM